MVTVKFGKWTCEVMKGQYENGRIVLVLYDVKDFEEIAVATTNIPEVPLEPDEAFIKDYSENEGMMDCLVKAGIAEPTEITVRTGFVIVRAAKILRLEEMTEG